ncbi:hypothetical protein QCA50_013564 [Cerrena zonata]|uniref:Uncharacterized protein n=1 Tax=Cerrena zonata TaxID=2478898 RepID=A0AAW0FT80_9APHY
MITPSVPPSQPLPISTVQTSLRNLSTANSSLHSQFFGLITRISRADSWTSAEVESLREEFEVFTQLLWKAKDIAGNIRTAATDLQFPILNALSDTAASSSRKNDVLLQWKENLLQQAAHAKELPDDCGTLSNHLKALSESHYMQSGVQNERHAVLGTSKEGKHGVAHIIAHILTHLHQMTRIALHRIRKVPVCGSDLTHMHSMDPQAAESMDQLKPIRMGLDQLGNEMGIFVQIYDEIAKEVDELQTMVVSRPNLNMQCISALRERLEAYARVLEAYQKTL